MSNKAPDTSALTKHFTRLVFADESFRQAKMLADQMITTGLDPYSNLFTPMMTGIVVTYAKNFNEANGMGPVPRLFERFADNVMQETHDKLLKARNELYAHRDVIAAKSFVYDSVPQTSPYQLRIDIKDEGGIVALPSTPELNPEHLPFIVRLCDFQSRRIAIELGKILPLIKGDKTYKPGRYTVGLDFP
jgi:hypothetical protein